MYDFLSHKVGIGLSRNKVLVVCSLIIGTILIIIFTGNNTTSESVNHKEIEGNYIKGNLTNNVDSLITKINDMAVLSSRPKSSNTIESLPMIYTHSGSADSVPDLMVTEDTRLRKPNTAAIYTVYSSKSLMYSRPIDSGLSGIGGNSVKADNIDVEDNTSPYEVKAGSIIPAIMLSGLNSELPGNIIALIRANIYDSITRSYILIPQGSKLIGKYDSNVIYAQSRVAVAWNRIIYPDGSSTNLKAVPGTDVSGYSGFYDQVDNHYFRIFGASFIMGVITGTMQYSQDSGSNSIGNTPTIGQTLAGSLGQQMGQTGMAITQKNLNIAPTIVIRPNYPFNIIITSDLKLKPFAKVD